MGTLAKEYLRKMQGFSTRSEIEKDVEDSVAQVNLTGKPSVKIPVKVGNVAEGKKRFYQQDNIGKAKFTINFHDGKQTHKDGSDFFGIKIFKNKKDVEEFKKDLMANGYKEANSFGEAADTKWKVKHDALNKKGERLYDAAQKEASVRGDVGNGHTAKYYKLQMAQEQVYADLALHQVEKYKKQLAAATKKGDKAKIEQAHKGMETYINSNKAHLKQRDEWNEKSKAKKENVTEAQLKDSILDGITIEELVDTVHSNVEDINKNTVMAQYEELLKMKLDDAKSVISKSIPDILKLLEPKKPRSY